jgi:hypothetical protein
VCNKGKKSGWEARGRLHGILRGANVLLEDESGASES